MESTTIEIVGFYFGKTEYIECINFLLLFPQAKAGIGMNLLAVTVLIICINTYGVPMFDLHNFPAWAGGASAGGGGPGTNSNVTLVCHNVTLNATSL